MNGFLTLQNGESFAGKLFSNDPIPNFEGEVVFYTGMTGYQEVLTDPSYKNQIIVFTYPLIGNYGINEHDFESKQPHVAGVVVYESTPVFSHYQARYSVKEYLKKWNIPLLTHVDTRAVVKRIRTEGTMLGRIGVEKAFFKEASFQEQAYPVSEVTSKSITTYGKGHSHIVLIDFGYKKSILTAFLERNCRVTVVPYDTSFEMVAELQPSGIVFSNGPGDPKTLAPLLPTVKKISEHFPTLGICLGHQLIALAFGGNTEKLSFGHRGANQPVKDMKQNKVYMTSQNHSYVVNRESLTNTGLSVRFVNPNDNSIEGMTHQRFPILTVQFHPEAHPGPSESNWIFDEFLVRHCTVRREKRYA